MDLLSAAVRRLPFGSSEKPSQATALGNTDNQVSVHRSCIDVSAKKGANHCDTEDNIDSCNCSTSAAGDGSLICSDIADDGDIITGIMVVDSDDIRDDSAALSNVIRPDVVTEESKTEDQSDTHHQDFTSTDISAKKSVCFSAKSDEFDGDSTVVMSPVDGSPKQSLLLRLFESKMFNMSIAIHYLFNSKELGVLSYLGKHV